MPTILFLSASERWNLGDLLFPIVFKHLTDEHSLNFTNVGIASFSSDDEDIIDVEPITKYIGTKDVVLIVGGGEVLGATITTLIEFLPDDNKLKKDLKSRIKTFRNFDWVPSRVSGVLRNIMRGRLDSNLQAKFGILSKRPLPFYTAVMPDARRYYLPVGGKFHKSGNSILALSKSRTLRIAGRDQRTLKFLPEELNPQLCPDPVSTIKNVFQSSEHKKRQVVIQFSEHKIPFDILHLAEALTILRKQNYKIVGLAIGRCPGHHDVSSLSSLQSIFPDMITYFDLSVKASVNLLSESEVYIGTSLHGAILAHAYGTAIIAIDEKVPKLRSYLNTWMPKHSFHLSQETDYDDMKSFLEQFDTQTASKNANRLAEMAQSYMQEVIENAYNTVSTTPQNPKGQKSQSRGQVKG
jgi:hypothetical protein